MLAMGTSGSMSGDGKRGASRATALILDSTRRRQIEKRLGCTRREESLAMRVDNINEFNANEIFSMDRKFTPCPNPK
jgi:hypothetical protein